jgi:hypothetical protein
VKIIQKYRVAEMQKYFSADIVIYAEIRGVVQKFRFLCRN